MTRAPTDPMNDPEPISDWTDLIAAVVESEDDRAAAARWREAGVSDPERAVAGAQVALASLGGDPTEVGALLAEVPDVGAALAALAMVSGERTRRELGAVARIGAQSAWLGRLAAQRLEVLERLTAPGLRAPRSAAELLEGARACCEEPEGGLGRLRRWRDAELARAFAREAWGLAPGAVTTSEVSDLASACLQVTLEQVIARRPLEERPVDEAGAPIPFVVVGLGKLGGRELNFGSDVDLVYLYGTDEGRLPSGEGGRWAVHEYFGRLARELTREMDAATADGRLWRMDLRLRPDGNQGPLVQSLAAMEAYYEAWGGTFERAVWLKARPVAGDAALGEALVATLAPFVYPRSLDTSALGGLRDMKGRIDRHASAQAHTAASRLVRRARAQALPDGWPEGARGLLGWDVKTGVGGIREIEFTTQALQLVYGGRRPEVRSVNTLDALERLLAAGLLPSRDVEVLSSAYTWYRLIEHRVQMDHNRHTHALPDQPEGVALLARRLGLAPEAFLERLAWTRAEVEARFERLLADPTAEGPSWPVAALRLIERPELELDDEALVALVRELGFERPRQSIGQLMVLRSKRYSPFSPRAPERLAAHAPRLLSAVCQSADPDLALLHLTSYVLALGHHRSYYEALARNPATLTLLVTLFGSSRYLSRQFVRDPQWFDELGSTERAQGWDRGALEAACERSLEGRVEPERRLEALRRFKHRVELRVALDDIAGVLEPEEVCRRLTALAEVCLAAALADATAEMERRFGVPREADGARSGFVILALGKLGGRELGYGSDLDLVFVYEGSGQTDGDDSRSNQEVFSRLGRRLIAFMTTRLASGRLYPVDTRLRPSGRQGTLVVSVRAFERYQRREATFWEHQALIKARVVAGDAALGARLEATCRELAYGAGRERAHVMAQVAVLRRRLVEQFASQDGSFYNLKADLGGLLDIEFAAQACQLVWGGGDVTLQTPATLEALRRLAEAGHLTPTQAQLLTSAYTTLRRLELRLRILEGTGTSEVPIGDLSAMRRLARRMGHRGAEPARELIAELQRLRDDVRAIYDEVVEGDAAREGAASRGAPR